MDVATSGSHRAAAVLSAWLVFLAVDFLLHAVVLAPWWRATEASWLPPAELFRRIPFAYAAFALYCAALVWLIARPVASPVTLVRGALVGLWAGLVTGVVWIFAVYSVLPVPISALAVWPISTTVESALAGGVAVTVMTSARPWRRSAAVFGFVLVTVVGAVVLQNLFFPTPVDRLR
jgi:hypothetical protein